MDFNPTTIVPLIQLAISPVILISGEGALMLTITNRMGRIVDRTRLLAGQMRQAEGDERQHIDSQLVIMWRRAKLLRTAVTFCGLSMSVACCLVLLILVNALVQQAHPILMVGVFSLAVVLLGAALVTFLRDIYVSLNALGLEVERVRAVRKPSGKSPSG
ncbi:MAG: DUF2721 domain-containing protein [Opitutales bacterium]